MFASLYAKLSADEKDAQTKRYNATYAQNLNRTAKSRAAIQVNRAKNKIRKECASSCHADSEVSALIADGCGAHAAEASFVGRVQKYFLTGCFSHSQYQDGPGLYKNDWYKYGCDRARACVAMISAVASVVNNMFCGNGMDAFHTICSHTVDDCSIKMRGPDAMSNTTIYTVMNSIDSVHVIYDHKDSTTCSSVQLPTPLLVVEGADASGIDACSMATSLLTSGGVGWILKQWGINRVASNFKTFLFMGDSLKANAAAFSRECHRLQLKRQTNPDFQHHMALRLRCSVHTVSLIRKPIVLLIPHFWTTLVRLAHLYEGLTFRKQMASSLTSIICQSFVCIQSKEVPEDFAAWRKDAESIRKHYWSFSVRKREALTNILEFLNGDLRQFAVVHHCQFDSCGNPCCRDAKESLNKALRLIVPWFAGGFQVPLLYRFKHYDQAAGFIHIGASVHRLLIRALALVDTEAAQSLHGVSSEVIEKLMGHIEADELDLEDLIVDQEESFQQTNMKRKQLVKAETAKPAFAESTLIVSLAISPMEGLLNRLFKRTSLISKLTLLGEMDAKFQESVLESMVLFLDMMSGRVGWSVVAAYQKMFNEGVHEALASGRLKPTSSSLQTILTMVIICMTDSWRRFVLDHGSFPHILFQLVDADLPTFCELWRGFQETLARCPDCVDDDFSKVLLSAFATDLESQPLEVQTDTAGQVTALLAHIATYAPLPAIVLNAKTDVCNGWFAVGPTKLSRPLFLLGSPHSYRVASSHLRCSNISLMRGHFHQSVLLQESSERVAQRRFRKQLLGHA